MAELKNEDDFIIIEDALTSKTYDNIYCISSTTKRGELNDNYRLARDELNIKCSELMNFTDLILSPQKSFKDNIKRHYATKHNIVLFVRNVPQLATIFEYTYDAFISLFKEMKSRGSCIAVLIFSKTKVLDDTEVSPIILDPDNADIMDVFHFNLDISRKFQSLIHLTQYNHIILNERSKEKYKRLSKKRIKDTEMFEHLESKYIEDGVFSDSDKNDISDSRPNVKRRRIVVIDSDDS